MIKMRRFCTGGAHWLGGGACDSVVRMGKTNKMVVDVHVITALLGDHSVPLSSIGIVTSCRPHGPASFIFPITHHARGAPSGAAVESRHRESPEDAPGRVRSTSGPCGQIGETRENAGGKKPISFSHFEREKRLLKIWPKDYVLVSPLAHVSVCHGFAVFFPTTFDILDILRTFDDTYVKNATACSNQTKALSSIRRSITSGKKKRKLESMERAPFKKRRNLNDFPDTSWMNFVRTKIVENSKRKKSMVKMSGKRAATSGFRWCGEENKLHSVKWGKTRQCIRKFAYENQTWWRYNATVGKKRRFAQWARRLWEKAFPRKSSKWGLSYRRHTARSLFSVCVLQMGFQNSGRGPVGRVMKGTQRSVLIEELIKKCGEKVEPLIKSLLLLP